MALVVNDRVKETSTTTGTGTFTLDGAVTGFETFSSAIGNSNTTYYAIEIPNSTEFEVGLGTVAAGTLARTTVISSSNSDALVDFSAGTKNVFCTLPASKAVIEDASNNVTLPADLTVGTDTFDVDSTNEKVNIGTTSGSYTGLNVFKKSGPGNIYVHLNGNPGTIIGTSLLSEGTSGDFVINTRDNADIRIYTNNTLRSEFKNNGNFYVDTDTLYVDAVNDKIGIGGIPTERLTVIGANNTSASELKVKDTNGRGILIESPYSGFGVGYVGTDGTNSALGFKVNGTELARFGTNGFLGIGTNNPQEEIHINGADPSIRIQDSDGGFTTITQAGNDLSFDVPGQINLDADSNGLVTISDGGTQIGSFFKTASTFSIKSDVQDKRLEIKGNDGGSEVVAVAFHMANAGQANFNDKIVLYANKVIEFGDAGETISGDGTDLTIASSRHIKLDATNDITLDAGAGGVKFDDDGITIGLLFNASGDLTFKTVQQDKDLNIKGNDGGSEITALTLDMSEAGAATFNSSVTVGANLDVSSGTIKLDGNFPAGSNNVALGNDALSAGAGLNNTMIGNDTGSSITSGQDNTGVGDRALRDVTTGIQNTGLGKEALLNVEDGSYNVAVGHQSLLSNVSGNTNTAVGYTSLQNATNQRNTAVGYGTGNSVTSGSNLTLLGYNAESSSATATNEITLGDNNVTSLRIPGLQSGASSGDVLTYDGTDITLSAPTGVSAGFSIAMAIAL